MTTEMAKMPMKARLQHLFAVISGQRFLKKQGLGNDKAATTIVAAISTSVKKYPMNVILDPPAGGLRERSMVKTSQILTISEKRLEKRLGIISSEKMAEVNAAIKLSLDIP